MSNPGCWDRSFPYSEATKTNGLPAAANDMVREGMLVKKVAGAALVERDTAGDDVYGLCYQHTDNTGGVYNARQVPIITKGCVELTVLGVTGHADTDAPVYTNDDVPNASHPGRELHEFTLTAGANNKQIGTVDRYIHGRRVQVALDL